MSDPNAEPIQVNASATPAQIAAGIRQVATILASMALAMGATVWAAKLNMVVALAPQIAQLITIVSPFLIAGIVWLGQMATRKTAKKLAVVAAAAPDDVAQVK